MQQRRRVLRRKPNRKVNRHDAHGRDQFHLNHHWTDRTGPLTPTNNVRRPVGVWRRVNPSAH